MSAFVRIFAVCECGMMLLRMFVSVASRDQRSRIDGLLTQMDALATGTHRLIIERLAGADRQAGWNKSETED